MAAPIVVEGLSRSYGRQRGVSDLTFTVEEGEVFGFLGPNGAGKTTTIRILLGLLRPSTGRAEVFGHDCWTDGPRARACIGFLPSDPRPYERMTGAELLTFFAAFRDGGDPARRQHLAARLELDVGRQIRQLSRGNRQKLAIVQALMHDAPLLILDEPSSGLDPLMQGALLELLREEQARGRTVFLSSHDLPEVERIAGRVGIIREGRLVAVEQTVRLRAARARRMALRLHTPAALDVVAALPGVRVLAVDPTGRHVELAVRGKLPPLLRALAELPLADLTFAPADLESVFLAYYDAGIGASVAVAEEEPMRTDAAP
jgi:ABC-2 type transport system ATP-binding protein